jgi:DNA adenine methylase
MPRPRKYTTAAEKQRAYRERKRNITVATYSSKVLRNDPSPAITNPPVRYYGGKWRIAPWVIQYFPEHITYVEPFCGGASVLFRKEPSKFEVINDLNGDVVNFFDVLRNRPDELVRAIQLTPYSRQEHKRAHTAAPADDLDRARMFYVRSRQSFGSGEGRWNTGWRYQANARRGTSVIDEWGMTQHLYAAAARLKLVQIECDDALKCIERFDSPDTLFYVDPPYPFSTRYSSEERYAVEMADEEHRQLAALLHQVQGKVMISGYMCELYEGLYQGWQCVSKDTRTNGNVAATEYLWLSPRATAISDLPLFINNRASQGD